MTAPVIRSRSITSAEVAASSSTSPIAFPMTSMNGLLTSTGTIYPRHYVIAPSRIQPFQESHSLNLGQQCILTHLQLRRFSALDPQPQSPPPSSFYPTPTKLTAEFPPTHRKDSKRPRRDAPPQPPGSASPAPVSRRASPAPVHP